MSGAGKKMEQAMSGFGRSVTGTIGSMLSFRNVLGSVLGTAGLGLLIKQSLDAADRIGEMATRTGLTSDALQELQHAAALSGASTEDLETGLRNLNRRLGEAAGGQKEAVALFASMGIAVKDAGGNIRDTDSVLGDFSEVMRGTASPAERTRLAMEAFGRSGTQLIPMLRGGRAGMEAMREEAQRLGLVLDSSMLQEANAANDALDRLARVLNTTLTRAVVQLAPHIEALAARLAGAVGSASEFLAKFLSPERAGSEELAARIADVTVKIERLQAVVEQGGGISDKINELFGHDPKGNRAAQLDALRKEREELRALLRERLAAETRAGKSSSGEALFGPKHQQALEEAQRILDSLNPTLTATDRKVLELGKRFDELTEQAGPSAAAVRAIGERAKETVLAVGQMDVWNKIVEDFEKALPTFDAGGKAIQDIRDKFRDAASAGPPALRDATIELGETLVRELKAFQDTQTAIKGVTAAYEQAEEGARAFAAFERQLTQPLEEFDDALRRHEVSLNASAQATGALAAGGVQGPTFDLQLQASLQSQITTIAQFRAQLNDALVGVDAGSQRFTELTAAIDRADAELGALSERLRTVTDTTIAGALSQEMDLIAKKSAVFGDNFDALSAKIQATQAAINSLLVSGVDIDDARIVKLAEQNKLLERQKQIVDVVGASIEGAMNQAAGVIVEAFLRGESAAIQWGSVVQTILADIIRRLIQVFIIDQLIKSLGGVIGSLGGLGGGGGGIALMAGGIVTKPTHALIGEAGPEAVIPLDRFEFGSGGVEITIIDQRQHGELERRETTGQDGRKKLEFLIKDVVKHGMAGGEFDRILGATFGMQRQGSSR